MSGKAPQQPKGPQMLYRAAVQAMLEGRFAEAIPLLEKALKAGKPSSDIYNNLGTAWWKCRDLAKAEANYRKALHLSPDSALALTNYGALLLEQHRLDEAAKPLERAYALMPDHASVANNYGLLLCWRGDFAPAEAAFRAAIAARPGWADAHDNLANVYRDTRRYGIAEETYNRALALAPGNPAILRDLGRLYMILGRDAQAEDCFRKALQQQPQDEKTLNLLLLLLEFTNRLGEAEKVMQDARARFPAAPGIITLQAKLLRRDGKIGEAIAEMESLATPPVNEAPFFYELGQLYDQAGETEKAFAAFARANAAQAARPEAQGIDRNLLAGVAARLKTELTPDFAAKLPAPTPEDRPAPVFLVGFPRSGTTLLDQILSGHPGVYVAEEIPAVDALGVYLQERFGTSGRHSRGIEAWGDACYPAAVGDLRTDDIIAMRAAFWRAHGVDDLLAGRLFIDRMPLNMMHAAIIQAVFPGARFILALRHPCDCVLSAFMQAFVLNPATVRFLDLQDGAKFYDEMFGAWEQAAKILPLKTHAVRYEDVVGNFRGTVSALLEYLGLPWNDAVLAFDRTARGKARIGTASYAQVTEKLYTRASGRWRRYRPHLEPVLELLRPHAERLGYSLDP